MIFLVLYDMQDIDFQSKLKAECSMGKSGITKSALS